MRGCGGCKWMTYSLSEGRRKKESRRMVVIDRRECGVLAGPCQWRA